MNRREGGRHGAAPEGNLFVTSGVGSELVCLKTPLVKIWDARGRGWRQACSERTPNKTGEELGACFAPPPPPYPPSTIPARIYPHSDHRSNLITPVTDNPPPLVTAAGSGEAAGTPLIRCGAARGNVKCRRRLPHRTSSRPGPGA